MRPPSTPQANAEPTASAQAPELRQDAERQDPELKELPRSPRTARLLTLSVLTVTAVASTLMALSLLPEARFALSSGPPRDVGELGVFLPTPSDGNSWVRGAADVSAQAARYTRPLDGDSYRLAPVRGNELLWVQMRVPEGLAEEHFLPPVSFVGRLLPLEAAGLRYANLKDAVHNAGGDPRGAWLIVDGEAPMTTRWAIGLVMMFGMFASFCCYGLFRLTRSVG